MKIAALLTCFNRKQKTLACLEGLFQSQAAFKNNTGSSIELEVFLTDDGCTDGTAQAVKDAFAGKSIHILQGTGDMFWAGGMRFAWKEAQKRHGEWDYYLLLNDDTTINADCFNELMDTETYSLDNYKQPAVVSGITCSAEDPTVITYGGDIIPNKFNGRQIRLGRSSEPQMVDLTNANVLLVPKEVVDKIGIFYEGYKHGCADNDYSMLARRKGIPVLITPGACGTCENDHGSKTDFRNKIINMSQKERTAYFNHPIRCNSDYLTFIRRNMPARYPLSWLFRMMLTYYPKLYFRINGARGI